MVQTHLFLKKGAVFSPCRTWRYTLERRWDDALPRALFVLLNPSTADEIQDDPTIRRCINFAKSWGYGSANIVNIFAFRSPYPGVMKKHEDSVGPENDRYILSEARKADLVILAWGVHGVWKDRGSEVLFMLGLEGHDPMCLGTTKDGQPKHPLYLRADTKPYRFMV